MYLISNRNLCSKEKYIKTIVEAAKNNVEYLILREKDLKYSELEKLYNEIVSELKENKADDGKANKDDNGDGNPMRFHRRKRH